LGYGKGDLKSTNKEEQQFLRLDFQRKKILELERAHNNPNTGSSIGSIMQDQSVQKVDVNYFTEGQMDYLDMNGKGLIENVR